MTMANLLSTDVHVVVSIHVSVYRHQQKWIHLQYINSWLQCHIILIILHTTIAISYIRQIQTVPFHTASHIYMYVLCQELMSAAKLISSWLCISTGVNIRMMCIRKGHVHVVNPKSSPSSPVCAHTIINPMESSQRWYWNVILYR